MSALVCSWPIVLQKSPSGLCEIEICNYRIGASVLLNRCCAFQLGLESIFLAEMLKILLQQNLSQSGRWISRCHQSQSYEYTPSVLCFARDLSRKTGSHFSGSRARLRAVYEFQP